MDRVWVDEIDGRVFTKNNTGFMFTELMGATPDFLDYVKNCFGVIADIGCAYGVATLPALDNSSAHMIAFDLSQEHLDVLRGHVKPEDADRVSYVKGHFPNDFQFEDNSLDAIHISFVMHYSTGEEFEEGLRRCYRALKPGGKLFINLLSIYFCLFAHLVSDYDEKLKQGEKWPGITYEVRNNQLSQADSDNVPEMLNLVSLEFLEQLLKGFGFKVEKGFYYDITKPDTFLSDGKGCVAVVACK